MPGVISSVIVMRRTTTLASRSLLSACLVSACVFDWDDLDPREANEPAAAASTSSSASASSASSAGGYGGMGGPSQAGGSGASNGGEGAGAGGTSGSGGTGGSGGAGGTGGTGNGGSGGAPGPLCEVPGNNPNTLNEMGCSGALLRDGSMNGSDSGSVAASNCVDNYEVGGRCCSFHIEGDGEWFLTDGVPVIAGGVPPQAFRSAGPCMP